MARVLITSTTTSSIGSAPEFRTIGRFSNGRLLALSETGGTVHYWTSPDGITWTDRGALPSASFTLARCFHAQIITVSAVEKLAIWYAGNATTGADCYLYQGTWDGTTIASGATSSETPISRGGTGLSGAAYYDVGAWHVALAYSDHVPLVFTDNGTTLYFLVLASFASSGWPTLTLTKSGSTFFLGMVDGNRNATTILPFTFSGTSYAWNASALETVATGANYHALLTDNAGNIDILYASGGTDLYVRKRTGTNTYSTASRLDALNPTQPQFSAVHDTSTDDLWVAYSKSTAQANGELYVIRRHGTGWQAPALIDGGDATGYQWPKLSGTVTTSGVDLLYLTGTTGTRSFYYFGVAGGLAPSAPVNLTHGDVAGLTPPLHADYVNASPYDPKKYEQAQAYDAAGLSGTLLWDSGQVLKSTDDTTYAGTTLTYNVGITWRRRDWDSITAGGAGTAGPWSTLATIIPRRAGTITLDSIISGGATSSSTIAGRILQVNGTYTHPDGHAASQWQFTLYEADGVTVHDQTAWTPFSPVLASGASFTTPTITTSVVNGSSYVPVLRVTDDVTGMIYVSAPVTYGVAFTPPPAPTAFSVIPDDQSGTVATSWTNPSGMTSVIEQYKPSDSSVWVTVLSGVLVNSKTLYSVPTLNAYDYRVAVVDAQGLQSAWATQTNITLGLKANKYGIWVRNAANLTQAVWLGMPRSYDVLAFSPHDDEQVIEPVGSQYAITSYGLTDYETADSMEFFIPGQDNDDITLRAKDVIATLQRLQGKYGVTCIWTDPKGRVSPVKVTNVTPVPDDDFDWRVSFHLRTTAPLNPPVY